MWAPTLCEDATPTGGLPHSSSSDSLARQRLASRPLWSEEERQRADVAAAARSLEMAGGRVHMAGATAETMWQAAVETGDYYWLVKATFTDKALAGRWETLHRG